MLAGIEIDFASLTKTVLSVYNSILKVFEIITFACLSKLNIKSRSWESLPKAFLSLYIEVFLKIFNWN